MPADFLKDTEEYRNNYHVLEAFDSSVLLEAVTVPLGRNSDSREYIQQVKNGNGRMPAITHEVLGEVTAAIFDSEVVPEKRREIALHQFKKIVQGMRMMTPPSNSLEESMDRIRDIDNHIESQPTDFLIVAKAVSEDVDKFYCHETWGLQGNMGMEFVDLSD